MRAAVADFAKVGGLLDGSGANDGDAVSMK